MATITHLKNIAIADGNDPSKLQPSDWNEDHVIDPSTIHSVLGIYVGTTQPVGMVAYDTWIATGTGYWAWMQLTGEAGTSGIATVIGVSVVASTNTVTTQASVSPTCAVNGVSVTTNTNTITGIPTGSSIAEVTGVSITASVGTATGTASRNDTSTITGVSVTASVNAVTGTGVSIINGTAAITGVSVSGSVNTVTGSGTSSSSGFTDDFTGTNGSAPNSTHWPTEVGDCTIQSNALRIIVYGDVDGEENPIEDSAYVYSKQLSSTSWIAEVTMTEATFQASGSLIIGAYSKTDLTNFNNTIRLELGTDDAYLKSYNSSGTLTTHASKTDFAAGGTWTLRLELSGSSVTAKVNGTTIGTGAYTHNATLGTGITLALFCAGANTGSTFTFDTFSVSAP